VEPGERNGGDAQVVAIVGWPQPTNDALAAAWRSLGLECALLHPDRAKELLEPGDVAVGRLDVLQTLDGVEPGIEVLDELGRRGVIVLNDRRALLDAHDKLRTAARLAETDLPCPRTAHISGADPVVPLDPPLVLKPRHGSWGVDVFRCENTDALARTLDLVRDRPWYRQHGAIVQELVLPLRFDLRIVVAGGEVVGATERVARPGEWRTNISLGGVRRPTTPTRLARELAVRAAQAIEADLVGVDLLPTADGYVVLELNGAVEFDRAYDIEDLDVYVQAARALGLLPPGGAGLTRDRAASPASARR
jgi:[lysine-biosynthesis-protein LysW]--L-2-aminoadipate ligase